MDRAKHFPAPITTVFARRVKPGHEAAYEEWLAGIAEASSQFPGSQGTTILKPSGASEEYIAVSQFDTTEHLEVWLCSDVRAEWLKKLNAISLDHEEVKALTGMERWFTLPNRAVTQPPARYKSAILVLAGLYPLVLGIEWLIGPKIAHLPFAVRILISLSISVPIMAWVVMPQLTRICFSWLYPKHRPSSLTQRDNRD